MLEIPPDWYFESHFATDRSLIEGRERLSTSGCIIIRKKIPNQPNAKPPPPTSVYGTHFHLSYTLILKPSHYLVNCIAGKTSEKYHNIITISLNQSSICSKTITNVFL